MAGKKGCGGKKGRSGGWNKRTEWNFRRLSELSMKRAVSQMERDEEKLEDAREKRRLEDRKDEITLKVLDKVIPQEIKLSGNGHKETNIILIRADFQENRESKEIADKTKEFSGQVYL